MIFCIQVAGNSMQIFASEVFPTNARASGFGWAAGVGRLATRLYRSDDSLDSATLGTDDGIRVSRHGASHCRFLSHSTRTRVQAQGTR